MIKLSLIKILLVIVLCALVHPKLVQVVSIFRHGARYQLNSLYDGADYKPFWGQISPAGMAQHQKLGETLRKQYIDNLNFISPKYAKGQIQFYSTIVNRTIQSLQSQMYGLYPPGTGQSLLVVNRSFYLPPYSTNKTDDSQHNFVLPNGHQQIPFQFNQKIAQDNCENQLQWYQKNIEQQIDVYNQMNLTYAPFLKKIAQIFNITGNVTFSTISSLTGNIQVSLHLGNTLPDNFTSEDLRNLRHLTDWYHQFIEIKDLAKAKNLYKFQKIMEVFDGRIKNSNQGIKWTFISDHDTDLLPLYSDLNLSTSTCVEQLYRKNQTSELNCQLGAPFASSLIFQLHQQGTSTFNIKIRSNGKYMNLCEAKNIECKYDDWKKRITARLGTDQLAQQICGNFKAESQNIGQNYRQDTQERLSWSQILMKAINKNNEQIQI